MNQNYDCLVYSVFFSLVNFIPPTHPCFILTASLTETLPNTKISQHFYPSSPRLLPKSTTFPPLSVGLGFTAEHNMDPNIFFSGTLLAS